MAEVKGSKKPLKYGRFVWLCVAVLLVFVAAAILGGEQPQVEERRLEPTVGAPLLLEEAEAASSAGGMVILDLHNTGFKVMPNKPGEPLRVDARYDVNSYRLEESFEPGDEAWTYKLEFRNTDSGLLGYLRELLMGIPPMVEVYLPADRPLDVKLRSSSGGGGIELAGLWIRSLNIDVEKSGVDVRVSEPVQHPADRVELRAAMAGFNVFLLGNASPGVLVVDSSMSGINLDLTGEWVGDSRISLSHRMSGSNITLPRGVRVVGVERPGGLGKSDGSELGVPTLSFSIDSEMSGVNILD